MGSRTASAIVTANTALWGGLRRLEAVYGDVVGKAVRQW